MKITQNNFKLTTAILILALLISIILNLILFVKINNINEFVVNKCFQESIEPFIQLSNRLEKMGVQYENLINLCLTKN
jgi:hypothetical protein